jgi:hypothetical protein
MPDEQDQKNVAAKKAAFDHPIWVPDDFKGWLDDFALRVSTEMLSSQIDGLRSARWRTGNPVPDPEVCNDTTGWSDLATVGPQITGMSDGTWLFIWGFQALTVGYSSSVLKVNDIFITGGGVPSNHDIPEVRSDNQGSVMGWYIATIDSKTFSYRGSVPLGNGSNNNTVRCVYGVSSAGKSFQHRFLHAIRIDELPSGLT